MCGRYRLSRRKQIIEEQFDTADWQEASNALVNSSRYTLPVLNRNESLLIFNHVTSAIRFVWALEQSIADKSGETDIPI
jgi:hypothetical protein